MIPYGSVKLKSKPHPHNECEICSEKNIIKKSARQESRRIEREAKEAPDA